MYIYIFFQFSEIIFFSFKCTIHNKTKILEFKNNVRVPSRMKLTKNPVFLNYFCKFTGILLFVLKYMYISLLLKMINGFSWPAKIMASPFKLKCLGKSDTEINTCFEVLIQIEILILKCHPCIPHCDRVEHLWDFLILNCRPGIP